MRWRDAAAMEAALLLLPPRVWRRVGVWREIVVARERTRQVSFLHHIEVQYIVPKDEKRKKSKTLE